MSVLDSVLSRIPEGRREDFLRVVHALNVRPDSPDLVQAYLAVEALAPILETAKTMSADLPEAMRSAGLEIVRGLATDVRSETVAGMREDLHAEFASYRKQIADTANSALSQFREYTGAQVQHVGDAAQQVYNEAHALSLIHNSLAQHFSRAWAIVCTVAALSLLVGGGSSYFGARYVCASHVSHVHAYHSLTQRAAIVRAYCP